jgi:hypothetical protein
MLDEVRSSHSSSHVYIGAKNLLEAETGIVHSLQVFLYFRNVDPHLCKYMYEINVF